MQKISEYDKEIKKSKDIISRFDEVILDKASKFSVDSLANELREYLKKDDFEQEQFKIEMKYRELEREFNDAVREINNAKGD